MLFSDSYLSLKERAEGAYRDRGSRFIACAFPVSTEEQIKQRLQEIRKLHPSAAHHCFAWRLGADKQRYRSYDDGEPAGTAGRPILGQIQSFDLSDVLLVVIRYFGGSLLGINGLITAYRSAAADALRHAAIEEKFIMFEYTIEFEFEDMNLLRKVLRDCECRITSQHYEGKNSITFQVRKKDSEKLLGQLAVLYRTKFTYLRTF